MPFSVDNLAALATTPIEGAESPAGNRVVGFGRLDDLVFAKLFNTLHPDPESVDWNEVLEEGTQLLERSRDLRFARWVAHALLETRGLEGLELGIRLLGDLVATFGVELLPSDNDKRVREVNGFDEFGAATLERLSPSNGDPGGTLGALEVLESNFSSFAGGALPGLKRIGEWLSSTYPEAKSEGGPSSAAEGEESTDAPADADSAPAPADAAAESTPIQEPARFQDLGSKPISESEPAGPRLTDWGRLATEYFQKLSSPTAAGDIDWRSVRDAALELLEHSKDIRAALVATSGLMRTEGLVGLADGLELLALLGGSFGDALHPRDPGDRLKKIAALDLETSTWFAEKKDGISADALDLLSRVVQQAQEARGALGAACGDDMILVRIGRAAGDRQKELEAEIEAKKVVAAEPTPAPVPAAGPRPTSAPRPASSGALAASVPSSIDSPAQADRALADAQKLVRAAVDYYGEKRPGEPFVLRLERVALWLHVTDAPPDGVITGPEPETVERLIRESATGALALDELEAIIKSRPLWLTGQRLIHDELVRQDRREEAESIRAETAAFVASLPGLVEVGFQEDVPFVDEATLDWLGSGGDSAESGASEPVPLDNEEEREALQTLQEQAKALASEGKLPEAIALYQSARRQSRSARQSFLWKLELARFCSSRNASIATSILNDLEGEITDKGIATWEPDLAIAVYTELLKLTSGKDSGRRDELFGKLVLVDPERAATIQFTPPGTKKPSAS